MSREQIIAELQRRGVAIPPAPVSTAPAPTPTAEFDREAILAELARRDTPQPANFLETLGAIPPIQSAISMAKEIPSAISGVEENLQQRGRELADIVQATDPTIIATQEQTKQPLLTSAVQIAGTEAGALGDVLGGIASVGIEGIPEAIKEPFKQGIQNALGTEAGQKAIEVLNKGVDAWKEWEKNNPKDARTIRALGNLVTFGAAGFKAAPATIKGANSWERGFRVWSCKSYRSCNKISQREECRSNLSRQIKRTRCTNCFKGIKKWRNIYITGCCW